MSIFYVPLRFSDSENIFHNMIDLAPRLSLVIPVRNERHLGEYVSYLYNEIALSEIIVVETSPQPTDLPPMPTLRYFHRPALSTRAQAMNVGAEQATTPIVWFLHCDCWPSTQAAERILESMGHKTLAGCFVKTYEPSCFSLSLQSHILSFVNFRWKMFLVGTNGFFVQRTLFQETGGFPLVPFLEDVLVFDQWKNLTHFTILKETLRVSSRKYLASGVFLQMTKNILVYLLFRMGFSPKRLASLYR